MSLPVDHANGQNATARAEANGELVNRVQQLRLGAQAIAPKRAWTGGTLLPWVLCGMLALAWASIGVKWTRTRENAPAASGPTVATVPGKPTPATASSTGAVAGSGDIVLQLKGNLIPFLQVAVSPIDVAGEVVEVNFKEGDRVKKGFPLVTLRDNRYRNEWKTAEANVIAAKGKFDMLLPESVRQIEKEQADAELEDAQATLERAQRDLRRLELQRGSGTVAQQEMDKAEADVRSGKARVIRAERAKTMLLEGPRKEQIEAARAEWDASIGRRDEAKRMLDNCIIKAPIDGTVLSKKSDVGGLVNPLAFSSSKDGGGASSGSVCEIADLGNMEVELDVPERDITKVRVNQDCQILADADPNRIYRGRVDRVMPVADDSKNVIKVRVQVFLGKGEEPGSFLKPKMSVVVTAYNRDYKN